MTVWYYCKQLNFQWDLLKSFYSHKCRAGIICHFQILILAFKILQYINIVSEFNIFVSWLKEETPGFVIIHRTWWEEKSHCYFDARNRTDKVWQKAYTHVITIRSKIQTLTIIKVLEQNKKRILFSIHGLCTNLSFAKWWIYKNRTTCGIKGVVNNYW